MKMGYLKKVIFCLVILLTSNCPITNAITIPREKAVDTKEGFLGKWNMQTIVTSSNCPYILTGTTTESNLEIKTLPSKRESVNFLKALWKGGKWANSSGTIKLLNDREAITERVTNFKTTDRNNWKSILIDHLKLTEENTIHSESIVIQYKNGQFIGEYKTFSILTKSE
jgi:hypothetical protein